MTIRRAESTRPPNDHTNKIIKNGTLITNEDKPVFHIQIVEEATEDQTNLYQEERTELELYNRNAEFRKRCLRWTGKIGRMAVCFNPLSTISAALIIWAVIIWSILDTESIVYFKEAQRWITDKCTWIYVATQAVWAVFLFVVYFKFGHIKLGLSRDIPSHSNFDYFAMIFTTGICNGILQDSVIQPIVLYSKTSGTAVNYWGASSEEGRAQNAMSIMMFHWGFHGFCVYVIPGLLIAALSYRKGLPVTMRTCFYPVFGKKIFGRTGDVVDCLSLICIAFGVSTSFMIGSKLLVVGLNQISNNVVDDSQQNIIITTWAITLMAMVSAMSGLQLGIRRMSQLCFIAGAMFLVIVTFSDDIWFILNALVQSVGYYFQYFIGMSGFTGAFQQKWNHTRTMDGLKQHDFDWMHEFTIFYWGWWIGWAPLVSMFIARLSRGRYIKDVIMYAYILPVLATNVWIGAMGAIAIDTEHNNPRNLTCNNGTTTSQLMVDTTCIKELEVFFSILNKYEDISEFLRILALIIIVLYYVTSFDTAALVMDSISSNGETDPPMAQRIFWCATVGATTTALVYYEDYKGFEQVHAFTVICGLPFTVVLCFCTVALWRLLKKEPGWRYDLEVKWEMFYGNINSVELLKKVILMTLFPWYFLGEIVIERNQIKILYEKVFTYIKFAAPFYLWILLLGLCSKYKNVDNIAWTMLIALFIYSSNLRKKIRQRNNIEGNILEDFCLMVVYPVTILQMYVQMFTVPEKRQYGLEMLEQRKISGNTNPGFTPSQNEIHFEGGEDDVNGSIPHSFNEMVTEEMYEEVYDL